MLLCRDIGSAQLVHAPVVRRESELRENEGPKGGGQSISLVRRVNGGLVRAMSVNENSTSAHIYLVGREPEQRENEGQEGRRGGGGGGFRQKKFMAE